MMIPQIMSKIKKTEEKPKEEDKKEVIEKAQEEIKKI